MDPFLLLSCVLSPYCHIVSHILVFLEWSLFCLGTSKKLSLGVLIGMNHACISVKFSVFFITKMHDSQYFFINITLISHTILFYRIWRSWIKRAAKRQKNIVEAEMTKRQHKKRLRVCCCEDPLRRGEALCRCEDPHRCS